MTVFENMLQKKPPKMGEVTSKVNSCLAKERAK